MAVLLRRTYERQDRLAYMAGAIRVGALGDLLRLNGQMVRPISVDAKRLHSPLTEAQKYHLEKTVLGWSTSKIAFEWGSAHGLGEGAETFNFGTAVRRNILHKFDAKNPAHMVTMAGSLGHLACPPLELTEPYLLEAADVVTLGLIGRGIPQARLATALGSAYRRPESISKNIIRRLPNDEIAPTGCHPIEWLAHAILRLDVIPHTPHSLEHLDVGRLAEGVATLMDPDRAFTIPKERSVIAIGAAPFYG